MEHDEEKKEIVNDLLENGRQTLVKYETHIIRKIYKRVMEDKNNELMIALKKYFEQKWESEYSSSNEWFISFLNDYKNSESHEIYERVLTRTAEYGNMYMKDCPILSIILQLFFESIDDNCLRKTNVFDDLWFTITNDGLQSITNFSDYITRKVMKEQLKIHSILFQALSEYYRQNVFLALKQSNILNKGNLYELVLHDVIEYGWLANMKTIEEDITPKSHKTLLENLTSFYKKEKPVEKSKLIYYNFCFRYKSI